MSEDEWHSRIGKFCIVDYESYNGLKSALGELIAVKDNKLILRHINTGDISEVSIDLIKNSRIQDVRTNNDPH